MKLHQILVTLVVMATGGTMLGMISRPSLNPPSRPARRPSLVSTQDGRQRATLGEPAIRETRSRPARPTTRRAHPARLTARRTRRTRRRQDRRSVFRDRRSRRRAGLRRSTGRRFDFVR